MNPIQQTAGECTVTVYTDGAPLWPEINIAGTKSQTSLATLHDLRYCIDRVLAQLPEGKS